MAKEEIRYSDIYVQALTNKNIPCVDSGIVKSSFKQVLFSAHRSSCFANESQQDVSRKETNAHSPLNHGHNLQRSGLESPNLLL